MIQTYFNLANATSGFTNKVSFNNPDNDWVAVAPNNASLVITDNLTVLLWVKAQNSTGQDTPVQFVLNKAGFVGDTNPGYSWSISKAWNLGSGGTINNMEITVSGNNSYTALKNYIGSQTVWDNNWHMIGFRFIAGALDLFVDGVKDPSPTKRLDASFTTINDGTDVGYSNITLGAMYYRDSQFTYAYDYVGLADEPAIWNSTFSDAQMLAFYNNGHAKNLLSSPGSTNLKLWYRCGDDGRDNNITLYDQTSNGNHASWGTYDIPPVPLNGNQYSQDAP